MSEKSYRFGSPVKSFKGLEFYQKTIKVSSEITKFGVDSKEIASKKLTEELTIVTDIITKLDLLREIFSGDKAVKEDLDKLLTRYQTQKRKILNLRNAWDRIFTSKNPSHKISK